MSYQQFDPRKKDIDADKLLDPDKPDDDNDDVETEAARAKSTDAKTDGTIREPYIKPGALKPPGPRIERPTTSADFRKVSEVIAQMRRIAGKESDAKKLLPKLQKIAENSGFKFDDWLNPTHWANYKGENQHAQIIKHLTDADLRVKNLREKAANFENG